MIARRTDPLGHPDRSARSGRSWGRWAPVAAVIAAIWTVSVLPGDAVPTPGRLDLLGHGLEFALLGAAASRASRARSRALTALSIALVVAVGTEASQLLAPMRSADVADVAADLLGAELGILGWVLTGRARRGQVRDGSLA